MSLGRRMFAGSLWCALDGWASESANLVIFLVLARLLSPEEFGLVALAAVFTTVATDLGGYAITQVLIQKKDVRPGLCDSVFFLVLALALAAAAAFLALAPWVASLFGAPQIADLLRLLSVAVVLNGMATVPLALLTRELRFATIAKRSLAMIAAGGAAGVGLAFAGYGAYALVGQALAQAAISVFVLFAASSWRPGRRGSWQDLREVRAYASGVVGNRVIALCDERAPKFVLGLVLGPAAVGYYNISMRLIDILIRLFVVPVNQVALPAIARVQEDPARVRGIVATGIGAASLISCPAFIGTLVIAPELLPVALGAQWLPAVPVLQLLALRGIVWPVVMYGISLLYGLGQPGRLLSINGIDLALNFALLCLAAPFGIVWVAAASSLRVVLVRWPLVGRAIGQAIGVGVAWQIRLMAPALLSAAAMAAALVAFRAYALPDAGPHVMLAALVGLGLLLYPLFVVIVNPGVIGSVLKLLSSLRRPEGEQAATTPAGG
jgi:O-antigen/teichoic acid export membrane protein